MIAKRIAVALALLIYAIGLLFVVTWRTAPPSTTPTNRLGAAAGQVGPFVFPPSWKQASWFIDPQNTSTCASDNNRTCSLSTCGTSGDGPCKSYGSIQNRWGTTSPLIAQLTTLTWMSSEASATVDPVVLTPQVAFGGFVWVLSTMTTSASTTITVVAAKSRSANQPLQVTFASGTPTQGVMVHNTTHPSRAWVDIPSTTINAHVGALMTQPMVLAQQPPSLPIGFQSEVDTWATSDSVVFETPQLVNLRRFEPIYVEGATSPAANQGSGGDILDVWVPSPSGAIDGTTALNTTGVIFVNESRIDPLLFETGYPQRQRNVTWDNNWVSAGGEIDTVDMNAGAYATLLEDFNNGIFTFDADAVVHNLWNYSRNSMNGDIGSVYLTSSADIRTFAHVGVNNIFGLGIYGQGILRAEFGGGWNYPAGAGQAVATFNGTTIFVGFNSNATCLIIPSATNTTQNCNIALSTATLDSNLGATIGCLAAGSSAYCNGNF